MLPSQLMLVPFLRVCIVSLIWDRPAPSLEIISMSQEHLVAGSDDVDGLAGRCRIGLSISHQKFKPATPLTIG